jgi:acyl carrier protein
MSEQSKIRKINVTELKEILKSLNAGYQVDRQTEDSDLFAVGVLDSLSLIQYVMALEKKFKIRLDNDDITYAKFKTFRIISELLNGKYFH